MTAHCNIANLALTFQGRAWANAAFPWIGPMNTLPRDKQIDIIAALTEGCSIRATERLTGVHRDTVMRLGARVGRGCARLHDYRMMGLRVGRIELDELWSYVGKKQRRTTRKDETVTGDQWLSGASDDALAKFDSRLSILTQLPLPKWKYEHAHKLKGKCKGLFELLFEANGVAHRPLCCFAPNRMEFTVLLFAVEHNNHLRPPEACKSALAKCDEIRRDPTRASNYNGHKPEIFGETVAQRLPKGLPSRFRH